MAYDPGAIDATLAAAVGDDPDLIAELRLAFVDSAERTLAAMAGADAGDRWCVAAWRLQSLAASFGAVRLMALATEAVQAGAPDAMLLGKLQRMVARLQAGVTRTASRPTSPGPCLPGSSSPFRKPTIGRSGSPRRCRSAA